MYCKHCGSFVDDNLPYCKNCGAQIEEKHVHHDYADYDFDDDEEDDDYYFDDEEEDDDEIVTIAD